MGSMKNVSMFLEEFGYTGRERLFNRITGSADTAENWALDLLSENPDLDDSDDFEGFKPSDFSDLICLNNGFSGSASDC